MDTARKPTSHGSDRHLLGTIACGLIFGLAVCAPPSTGAQAKPLSGVSAPSADPLLRQSTRWTAVSTTAMGITGDIVTAPGNLRLAGFPLRLTFAHTLNNKSLADAATLFSTTPSPDSLGALYHVAIPARLKLKSGNTLCGSAETTWILLVRHGSDLSMATFSGATEPDLTPSVLDNSTLLCGTYGYTLAR